MRRKKILLRFLYVAVLTAVPFYLILSIHEKKEWPVVFILFLLFPFLYDCLSIISQEFPNVRILYAVNNFIKKSLLAQVVLYGVSLLFIYALMGLFVISMAGFKSIIAS
jgi:hypothetical protein